jgi:phospholipid/cholesterol/gamma-HCH transport system ATP-binding protein
MVTAAGIGEQTKGHSVLDIAHVTISSGDEMHAGLMHGNMHADAGDLVLIQVADLHQGELWADVAVGLLAPQSGRVSLLDNDLSDLALETGNRLRGWIGRAFSRGNWMDRLSILDNVLLSAQHHSERDYDELKAEASTLAASFGMPGIPLGMPDGVARIDLQRAACARAFLGEPVMVILEDPTYAVHEILVKPLMDAIRNARDRGAAVLWFTPSLEIWRDRSIPVSRRYRMTGDSLMEVATR